MIDTCLRVLRSLPTLSLIALVAVCSAILAELGAWLGLALALAAPFIVAHIIIALGPPLLLVAIIGIVAGILMD